MLSELKGAGGDAWKELEQGATDAWGALKSGLERVSGLLTSVSAETAGNNGDDI